MNEKQLIAERIESLTGWNVNLRRLEIITDTTEWMNIYKGCVVRLQGGDYVIRGNMREPRFGIDDQPKYWVFSAIELETGREKIIKTVFNEEFYVHIGIFKIRCYRSQEKESAVLELMRGNELFMQGRTAYDDKGNNVRIIDYIKGRSLFHTIPGIPKTHEEYFREDLPGILWKLVGLLRGIAFLHENRLCHGDIRNDHIIIETDGGGFRWIDFDLKQDVSDFDLWSIGNLIGYAVGKGIVTFDAALKNPAFSAEVKQCLSSEDGSAFYTYRVMNLSKLFPYIPPRLSRILRHFTTKPIAYYTKIHEFLDEYAEMLEIEFPDKKIS